MNKNDRLVQNNDHHEYIKGVKQGLYPPFDKHIWQRGYFDHAIRNIQDYEESWKYIDESLLRWLIKHNKIDG